MASADRGRRSSLRPDTSEIGEVEGSGLAVQEADRRQQHRGGEKVQGDVREGGVELCVRPMERHQHEGRDQHHFEPDVRLKMSPVRKAPETPINRTWINA